MNLFHRRRSLSNRRATATVEFAVIAPVFLTLILGMLEASRLFDTYGQLAQVARDGARLGAMDRADWVAGGTRTNDKIISDIRNSLEASGYDPDMLQIYIEPAGQPGESFNLDDPNNDLDLFQVRIALPVSQVAAMPVPDNLDYDLSTAVIFRNTKSTIVQQPAACRLKLHPFRTRLAHRQHQNSLGTESNRSMASKSNPLTSQQRNRRGVFIVLAAFVMIVLFAFLSLGIDSGLIAMEQTRLQNAVDAAALAASQEITSAIQNASDGGDPNSISLEHARAMATDVADRNGVYVNGDTDVVFGKRTYDEGTGKWEIAWNEGPYNVVKVTARRDQPDMSARDSKVPLAFGWAVGTPTIDLRAEAIAFVEARDMVVVLDFSGSMNDDSRYSSISRLGQDNIEANMVDIFNAMAPNVGNLSFDQQYLTIVGQPPTNGSKPQIKVTFKDREIYVESTKDLSNVVLEFDNGYHYKYDGLSGRTKTFRGPGSYNGRKIVGCWVKSGSNASGDGPGYGERFRDTNQAVKEAFGLANLNYPYSRGSWDEFINYSRDNIPSNSGNRQKYGKQNFVDYLLTNRYHNYETQDLWKAPHYPFHAVKNGFSLFLDFLTDLDFGDEVGIVSYDESSRVEHTLNDGDVYASLNGNLISDDYSTLDTIQRHKQAGHYGSYTAMGFGVNEADELLQAHSRHGARPTIVLMTDGNANRYASGWNLPYDWNWADYTDYDGDGNADYTTSDRSKQYAIWEAVQAHNRGVTIHTMSVGASADRDVMTAIANACGGIHISVPGGSTIAELEAQMLSAFQQIAAKVPPPQLVYDLSQAED